MALSPIDIYKVLPQTNCKECGELTCLAFAAKVVSENIKLDRCPHVSKEILTQYQQLLDNQHKKGIFAKKDVSKEALEWAKNRAASMKLEDIAKRVGGELVNYNGKTAVKLPYFNSFVYIMEDGIFSEQGELNHWEQVFLYNHMAQGGEEKPTGIFVPFHELPNTVSKIKSYERHIIEPLVEKFTEDKKGLKQRAQNIGAEDVSSIYQSADIALKLKPLPMIPIIILFWDKDEDENLPPSVSFLFDKNIIKHLDIESILFLLEKIVSLLLTNKK